MCIFCVIYGKNRVNFMAVFRIGVKLLALQAERIAVLLGRSWMGGDGRQRLQVQALRGGGLLRRVRVRGAACLAAILSGWRQFVLILARYWHRKPPECHADYIWALYTLVLGKYQENGSRGGERRLDHDRRQLQLTFTLNQVIECSTSFLGLSSARLRRRRGLRSTRTEKQ